jgi:hypothetical protein
LIPDHEGSLAAADTDATAESGPRESMEGDPTVECDDEASAFVGGVTLLAPMAARRRTAIPTAAWVSDFMYGMPSFRAFPVV